MDQNINSEYESLKASKFKQQKLPAWRPVPSICVTIAIFLSFGVIFIIIGAIVIHFSNDIFEETIPYDIQCKAQTSSPCTLQFTIPKDLDTKVMFYYKLTNFYQNHRRYVKSKSNSQLLGNVLDVDAIKSDCDPVIRNKDIKPSLTSFYKNTPLPAEGAAFPCGLIAKSFFNDTYTIQKLDDNANTPIPINTTNIAWPADLKLKYKRPVNPADWSKMWMDTTNEHFVVWMRPAGLPDFRKLWGRIDNMKAGKYNLIINDNYPTTIFNGSKSVVLSTVNAFGGKNIFLGYSYIVVGGICILMAIGFFIGDKIQKKNKTN
jgi:hypothetical protein